MLDQVALDKIHRNLKRCRNHPGKTIPVEIFQRDVSMLMADIATRVCGDLNPNELKGDLRQKVTTFVFKAVLPNADSLFSALKGTSPHPAYVYEQNVKELLNTRWQAQADPDSHKMRRTRLFMTEMMNEFRRMGDTR